MIPASIYGTICAALVAQEHAFAAYFDGDPRALEDAAACREALAWLQQVQPSSVDLKHFVRGVLESNRDRIASSPGGVTQVAQYYIGRYNEAIAWLDDLQQRPQADT